MLELCDICKGTGGATRSLKVGAVPATMGGRDFPPSGLGYGTAYAICKDCEDQGWQVPEIAPGGQIIFKNIRPERRPRILLVSYSDERRV